MPSNNSLEKVVNLGQLQMAYEAGALLPVDISTLTPASTFPKNAVVGINGVLYRATAATQNLPCTLTVQDGQFVVNIVDGRRSFVVTDPTPNEGWEVFTDASIEYWVSQLNTRITALEGGNVDSELFVDMGLPSGVLWAKASIDLTTTSKFQEVDGAVSPFKYECSFFSWGNIDGHNPSSTSAFDYDWGGVNEQEPYYDGQVYGSTPGNTLTGNIPPSMDAARVNLGAPWRMPSNADFTELFANIDYIDADGNVVTAETSISKTAADKRVTVNGINGLYLRSKINGNRLFFPASGYGSGRSWYGRTGNGDFWSSTFGSARYARDLYFGSGGVSPQGADNRCYGFSVRPVR